MDGHFMHYQLSHSYQSVPSIRSLFNIDWPSASQHPLFYVGIYAAIGLLHALCTILSAAAQYTGALRASRVLFKWVPYLVVWQPIINLHSVRQLLVTVVRATFRFHDTTPQGKWYTDCIRNSSHDLKWRAHDQPVWKGSVKFSVCDDFWWLLFERICQLLIHL